jgi:hypothetical protein
MPGFQDHLRPVRIPTERIIPLEQIFYWIAAILTLMMMALMLAIDLVALSFFALVAHHLVFDIGLENWSSIRHRRPRFRDHRWQEFVSRYHRRRRFMLFFLSRE